MELTDKWLVTLLRDNFWYNIKLGNTNIPQFVLPAFTFSLPDELKQALFDGYIAAKRQQDLAIGGEDKDFDGGDDTVIIMEKADESLAIPFRMMAGTIGLTYASKCIHRDVPDEDYDNPYYDDDLSYDDEGVPLQFIIENYDEPLAEGSRRYYDGNVNHIFDETYARTTQASSLSDDELASLPKELATEIVYDLTVDDDNSYTVNGVVVCGHE